MRWILAAALALGVASGVVAQAPKQIQIYASVVNSAGVPTKALDADDVHVTENGIDATVTKVERLDCR